MTISARYDSEEKTAEFKVADTGIGIPQQEMPGIFDMFHQIDKWNIRNRSGVGIGLYIVRKFTEMLGGKVEVKSTVGEGTVFTVTIPCEA